MPPKGWKKNTDVSTAAGDDSPEVSSAASAAAPVRSVEAGDVYQSLENVVAVIVAIAGDDALVAYSPSAAQAVATGWEKLKRSARRIALDTCEYHVECGNWALVRNVEADWK